MREIKFRGKRIDNCEWIYGNLLTVYSLLYGKRMEAIQKYIGNGECSSSIVDPTTVGQFTGLKDKNGEDIYEGDIIVDHVGSDQLLAITFDQGMFQDDGGGALIDWAIDCEVAGNIHDNQELLEVD